MIPYQTSKEIEKAIIFLVKAISDSGKNPKPVILHSIMVGLSLVKLDYPFYIVQAGFLHDVVEDSEVGIDEIKRNFGDEVASLVAACTYDDSIEDKVKRYQDAIYRAKEMGKNALIVMAADLIQNEPYYPKDNFDEYPWDKMKFFIQQAESVLKDEPIWEELKNIKHKIYSK